MTTPTVPLPSVGELRADIRQWRKGRADTRLGEVLSDAYIGVFAVVMLGAMGVNVLLELRAVTDTVCTTPSCTAARASLPWLFAACSLAACLAVSRLFGPMLVTPAVGSWLLPTPADRGELLRRRFLVTTTASAAVSGALATAAAALAGFEPAVIAAYALLVAAGCVGAVALCVVAQGRAGGGVRTATWLLVAAAWVWLLLLANGAAPTPPRDPAYSLGWPFALAGTATLAVLGAVAAARTLPRLGRAALAPGGALAPSLSGALAMLDLALVFDVLLARRWRDRSRVRAVRRLPRGLAALVARDVVRLRRDPVPVVVLAGALVMPYLAATLDLGSVTVLVGGVTAFLAGLRLFSGVRVLSRTPGLVRCLPFPAWQTYAAAVVVPCLLIALWGVATAPALHHALDGSWGDAVLVGLAVGVAGSTAATRWMVGKPPDYQMALISSPAGAVPPAVFAMVARGFDIVLLVTAPLLLAPSGGGAAVAIVLGVGTLSVLLGSR